MNPWFVVQRVIEGSGRLQYLGFEGTSVASDIEARYGGRRITHIDPRAAGRLQWHDATTWAIRFARATDAERMVVALLGLADAIPLRDTMAGLRRGDPLPVIVEIPGSRTEGGEAYENEEEA